MLNTLTQTSLVFPLIGYQRSPSAKSVLSSNCYPAGRARKEKNRPLRLGLLVPFHGSDAIWGPSCQYSAVLAAAEINRGKGVLGKEIELFAIDAGGDPDEVVTLCWDLVKHHQIDALIGVHLSSVRVALRNAFAGLIPYVFAPLYEGGETTPGVFAIGDTPQLQFPASIRWMMEHRGVHKWHIVGNDYIWPRTTHESIRKMIQDQGGQVAGEDYLQLGEVDISTMIERIRSSAPQIIFESLVGSDCVVFNRAFSEAGLSKNIIRISGSIEENTLLGIGAEHTHNLYCAASYFSTLSTPENKRFMDQYRAAYGRNAPVQGVLSLSCYDAIHFFAALAERAGELSVAALGRAFEGLKFYSVRGEQHITSGRTKPAIYLAEADGIQFNIMSMLKAIE